MSDVVRDRLAAAIGAAYTVEQEIGRGGMGIVYRALDVRLKRHVAVKVLPPDLAYRADIRARFLREAETAAQLSHPNIVQIFTVDEREGLVYFVMALVDGESLGARLKREPQLPVDTVRRILHGVADALACAHAHGVIHRDIKPDNILLETETGRPMVTDFGIARAAEADARLTMTGVAMGSPAYMSPEQAAGEREIDGRSDLYSLGLVGYQMLVGEPPFVGTSSASVMMKQINERPIPVRERRPETPPALAAAIERALEKHPQDRWPDAAAFRDAITASAARTTISAERRAMSRAITYTPTPQRPAAPPPEPPRPPRSPAPIDWRQYRDEWRRYGVDWKQYSREQRRIAREQARLARQARQQVPAMPGQPDAQPIDRRIVRFRRSLISQSGVMVMLAGINAITSPHFPWFLFPTLGMGMGLVGQWSRLWSEGVTWRQIWHYEPHAALQAEREDRASIARQQAQLAKLLPREVRESAHAEAVRRAIADREAIVGIVESLAKPDRALLPDVIPTVNALVDRTASLAQMLHRLDADIAPGMLAQIEARIAQVEHEPESAADRERRLALLHRQRGTLADLSRRRDRVAAQLDSAGLALQNLRLDLLKLRSSGVQSAIGDVNNATVEARALSKEISHVLDAADEIRKL